MMAKPKTTDPEAEAFERGLVPIIEPLLREGKTVEQIARAMTRAGLRTRTGGEIWLGPAVERLIRRHPDLEALWRRRGR